MALSYDTPVYAGGAQTFPVSFALGVGDRDNVKVYVVGELDGAGDQLYRDFTWNSDSEILVTDALTVGDSVRIQRTVSKTTLVADYTQPGSATRENLQATATQSMMAIHEFIDGRIDALPSDHPSTLAVLAAEAAATEAEAAAAVAEEAAATAASSVAASIAATAADAAATAADRAQTGADVISTAAARAAAEAAATASAASIAAAAAAVAATAADRAQTGAARDAAAVSAASAAADAAYAAASASIAAGAAGAAGYATRAEAEAALTGSALRITVAGFDYAYDAAGTALTTGDGRTWKPFGYPYADHYATNTTPGVTNMGPAINLCLSNHASCYLEATTYATHETISYDNGKLVGRKYGPGVDAGRTRILGISAQMAATAPLLKLGRTTTALDFDFGFDTLTGAEVAGERVGWDCAGNEYVLQRGSVIDRVRPINCGTALVGLPFSVTIGTLEIGAHSFCAIDNLVGGEVDGPTGNYWGNIYINGNDTYTPAHAIRLGGGIYFGGVIGQLNIEHGNYTSNPAAFYNCAGLQVHSLHIEGVKLLNAATDFVYMEGPLPKIGTLTCIHNGAWGVNCGLVGFGETWQSSITGTLSHGFRFSVDRIEVRGLLRPNTVPSGYVTGTQDWVSRNPGWRWFTRRSGAASIPVMIDVADWCFSVYNVWDDDRAEMRYYRNPWFYSKKTGLQLVRIGSAGLGSQAENLLRDPNSETVVGGTVYSATTSFATDYLCAFYGVGTITVERNLKGVSYLLNPGAGATYQSLMLVSKLPASFRGGQLAVYLELEDVDGLGCELEQVRVTVFNRSGTSILNEQTTQIIATGDLTVPAGGTIPAYATAVVDMSTFVWGSDPYIGLVIQANDNAVERTTRVRVRNVSLAVGADNPALCRIK